MSIIDINKKFYDRLYKKKNPYLNLLHSKISFDQQSKSKLNYQIIKSLLKQQKNSFNFLDYGFGHGSLLLKIPKRFGLFGCDISTEAVHNFPYTAKLTDRTIKTFTPDQLGSINTKFNLVSLSHVLEHIEDDLFFLQEMLPYIDQNGYLLINVPINEVWQDPKHVRQYNINSIKDLMRKCNLEILSITEKDKLSSFFLIKEKVDNIGKSTLFFMKVAKVFFATLPIWITDIFEKVFLKKHRNQQLIVLAVKK